MRIATLLILALLPGSLWAQTVTMPQTVTVAPYRLAAVEMVYDGDDFAYSVSPELDAFREYTTDPKTVRLRVQFVPRPDGPQSGTFQITAVAAKAVDGKGKLSAFQTCLVSVGGQPPVVVVPPPVVTPPVDPPIVHPPGPLAATVVYEKDNGVLRPAVLSALNKLNREKKIIATTFEEDTTDGTGQTPSQYKTALAAAQAAGLPALVVTAGDRVLRVVKNPSTEQDVLSAVEDFQ